MAFKTSSRRRVAQTAALRACLLGLAALVAGEALADRINNGGPGVACKAANDDRVTVETLDLYEARWDGLTVDLGAATLSASAKVELVFRRLARLAPTKARAYRQRFAELTARTVFDIDQDTEDGQDMEDGLGLIDDVGPVELGEGCALVQLARRTGSGLGVQLTLDRALWQRLDADNRAALMLHEVVYDEAIEAFGHETSQQARRFSAWLLAAEFDGLTPAGYAQLREESGFERRDY